MESNHYKCTQQELYAACTLGWNSHIGVLAQFTLLKGKYTKKFADDNLAAILSAQAIPDLQARTALAEIERINLTQITEISLQNWQKLKRYIADAFASEFQKPNLEAAGYAYYSKAANYSWDNVQGLLNAATNYMNTNTVILEANQNMPPAFASDFLANKDAFAASYQKFLSLTTNSELATQQKIQANNGLYDSLISMFLDGQEIFKNNETLKKQFIFDHVVTLVGGNNTAGIKGAVTNGSTGEVLGDVTITIMPGGKSTITNPDGHFQMLQVAADIYTITATAKGFNNETTENYEVKPGTVGTLNISLKPIA